MKAAVRAETLKLTHSLVGVIATLAMVLGVVALLGGLTVGVARGNPQVTMKLGPVDFLSWHGLLEGGAQITAIATLLGFGVVLAWMFGREFTDGTVAGLLALPVSRTQIALGKLVVYGIWATGVSLAIAAAMLFLGLVLGYGLPSSDSWAALGQVCVLGLVTAGLAVPIAWVATLSRSLLAAVGCTVGLAVVAEVGAIAGAGGWMPFAAPALWAMTDGAEVTAAQLALALSVPLIFGSLSCVAWARLQLDR